MSELTPLHLDTLGELLNIGMGRAASALGQLVHEEVLMSVPEVAVYSQSEVLVRLEALAPTLAAVRQRFEGQIQGDAYLIFPEPESLDLVRGLMGSPSGDSSTEVPSMTDDDREALSEVGNIVLHACLGSLANILDDEFSTTIPTSMSGSYADVIDLESSSDRVLYQRIAFSIQNREINGHVMFVSPAFSVQRLKSKMDELLGQA